MRRDGRAGPARRARAHSAGPVPSPSARNNGFVDYDRCGTGTFCPVAGNSTLSLRTHVETLAGSIGERNVWRYVSLQRAAEYFATYFSEMGYEPVLHRFEVSKLPLTNIEVVLDGDPSTSENLVVGSHYDTVPHCPGANDNATGVAAMLELARRFRERHCRHTLRFVAFVNEEPPFFQTPQMGSVVYANAARASGMRVAGML